MNLAAQGHNCFSLFKEENPTQEFYLGPAIVIKTDRRMLMIALPDENIWAHNAVSFPYQAEMGDKVLAIGRGDAFYIIGVLEGRGKSIFTAPGDLEIRTPRGKIDLVSSEGLNIRTSEMKVVSKSIEFVASSILEKYENAKRWVRQAFHLRAGSARTVVESTYKLRAERIVEKAKGEFKVDGEKIHLG
jgi:hypothetical protein